MDATRFHSDPLVGQLVSQRTDDRRCFVGGTYWWNHQTVRSLFTGSTGRPVFCQNIDDAIARASRERGRVVGWAARLEPRHETICAANGLDLQRIEDGFIRSVGLGAGFSGAASLAVDQRGIYYDATRPSDLEHLLQFTTLSEDQCAEGARIRQRIVALRLSKYNLRSRSVRKIDASGRTIVLVPGQVIDDASVLRSLTRTIDPRAPECINLQLLRQVRARNPEAYLVYKPHPDVHFGLRKGGVRPEEVHAYANLIVEGADIADLIEQSDAVETISSLVGFEALLRGKPVTVHGLPFYAGWGATKDLVRSPRRTTRRTIDELCFIAFACYTRHVDPATGQECSIHELLDALDKLRSSQFHQLRVAGLRRFARLCEFVAAKH